MRSTPILERLLYELILTNKLTYDRYYRLLKSLSSNVDPFSHYFLAAILPVMDARVSTTDFLDFAQEACVANDWPSLLLLLRHFMRRVPGDVRSARIWSERLRYTLNIAASRAHHVCFEILGSSFEWRFPLVDTTTRLCVLSQSMALFFQMLRLHKFADVDKALVWASKYGNEEIVRALLQRSDCDPRKDSSKCLRKASKYGQWRVVSLLIDDGRVKKNAMGNYSYAYAKERGHTKVMSLLEQRR